MAETLTLSADDGHQLAAYLATPAGAPKGRVVVIQEIFGVNVHIRGVCDGFAADGYAALAPALFDRVEPGIELEYGDADMTRGRELRAQCPWDKVVLDMAAARARLAAEGAVAVVGYCWGGSVTWLGATRLDFACAVGYYGGQIIDFVDETPRCPTLLHFGAEDGAIPPDDVDKIRAAHGNVPVHVYEGAGHGFNCERRASHHGDAAALARERTLAFFAEHLR